MLATTLILMVSVGLACWAHKTKQKEKEKVTTLNLTTKNNRPILYGWGAGSTALPHIEWDIEQQKEIIGSQLPVINGWITVQETPEEIAALLEGRVIG